MPQEERTREDRKREAIEDDLDRELEDTFPASDPLTMTRSSLATQITPKPPDEGEGS